MTEYIPDITDSKVLCSLAILNLHLGRLGCTLKDGKVFDKDGEVVATFLSLKVDGPQFTAEFSDLAKEISYVSATITLDVKA